MRAGRRARRGGGTGRRQAGFTLVEALVAMAVLGAVLAAVYALAGSQLRRIARADEETTLSLFAQNLLARSGLDFAGSPAASGVTPDGIRWSVTREAYDPPPMPAPPAPPPDLPLGPASGGGNNAAEAASGDADQGADARERRTADAGESGGDDRGEGAGGGGQAGGTAGQPAANTPPPVLKLVRITVENARGTKVSVTTLALEAGR